MEKIDKTLRQNIARNKKSTKDLQKIAKSAGFQMHKNNVIFADQEKTSGVVKSALAKKILQRMNSETEKTDDEIIEELQKQNAKKSYG